MALTIPNPRPVVGTVTRTLDLSVVIPSTTRRRASTPPSKRCSASCPAAPHLELILVNDGSTDATGEKALAWHEADPRVKVIEFRRNFGQTAGISAGFELRRRARGGGHGRRPAERPGRHPHPAGRLEDGYDVASGWRADRKDKLLMRRLPSKAANALISRVTGAPLHDYGCTLKAYDREVVEHLELFGELHRFIPALALISGAKVVEIPVNHRAREHGAPSTASPDAPGGARPPHRQVPHRLPPEAHAVLRSPGAGLPGGGGAYGGWWSVRPLRGAPRGVARRSPCSPWARSSSPPSA
jgi:hypothetical protein